MTITLAKAMPAGGFVPLQLIRERVLRSHSKVSLTGLVLLSVVFNMFCWRIPIALDVCILKLPRVSQRPCISLYC